MRGKLQSADLLVAAVTLLLGLAMIGGVELNPRVMGILVVVMAALQGFCAVRVRQKTRGVVHALGAAKLSEDCKMPAADSCTRLSQDGFFVPDSPAKIVVVAASRQQASTLKQNVPQSASVDQKAQEKVCAKDLESEKATSVIGSHAIVPEIDENKKHQSFEDARILSQAASQPSLVSQQGKPKPVAGDASLVPNLATGRNSPKPASIAQHNVLAHFQRLTAENAALDSSLKNAQEEAMKLRVSAHKKSLRLFRVSARLAHVQLRGPKTEKARPPTESKLLSVFEMQQVLKAESVDADHLGTDGHMCAEQKIRARFNKVVEEKRGLQQEVNELRLLANQNASALMAVQQRSASKGSPPRSVCSFSTQTDVSSFMVSSRPTTRDSCFSAADSYLASSQTVTAKEGNAGSIKNILARFSALEAELKELRPKAELVPGLEAERDVLSVEVAGLIDQLEARILERDTLSRKVSDLQLHFQSRSPESDVLSRRVSDLQAQLDARNLERTTLTSQVCDLQKQLESLRRLQGKEWHQLEAVRKILAPAKGPMFQIKWPSTSDSEEQSPVLAAMRRDLEAGGGAKLSIVSAPSDWRIRLQAALFSAGDPLVLRLTCKPNPEELDALDATMFGGFMWPAKEKDA
jgi:hypothetical protein